MILGFGQTEITNRNELEKQITEHVAQTFSGDMFTDEFIADVTKWIKGNAAVSEEMAEEYKTSEVYPDRYCYYFPYVVGDCNYICVILSIHHINRRHAMSPDGWALLQEKHVFAISVQDLK